MIRVYPASKLRHAQMWRELCEQTSSVQFHARWLKHNKIGTPDDSVEAANFWLEDVQDIKDADCVIVYAESKDHLRGALVEAGIALAFGIPVFIVGEHPDYGTWRYHPRVHHAPSIGEALSRAIRLTPRYRT